MKTILLITACILVPYLSIPALLLKSAGDKELWVSFCEYFAGIRHDVNILKEKL